MEIINSIMIEEKDGGGLIQIQIYDTNGEEIRFTQYRFDGTGAFLNGRSIHRATEQETTLQGLPEDEPLYQSWQEIRNKP